MHHSAFAVGQHRPLFDLGNIGRGDRHTPAPVRGSRNVGPVSPSPIIKTFGAPTPRTAGFCQALIRNRARIRRMAGRPAIDCKHGHHGSRRRLRRRFCRRFRTADNRDVQCQRIKRGQLRAATGLSLNVLPGSRPCPGWGGKNRGKLLPEGQKRGPLQPRRLWACFICAPMDARSPCSTLTARWEQGVSSSIEGRGG